MAVLPLVKLGTLALKTACKPIANRLKKEAGYHPKFRNFIISIAQTNHRFTTRIQRRIYSQATDVAIRPLNEEKAVQAAADLLGELFVFTVAGAAVIFEVQRSSRSEARKEELRRREIQAIKTRSEELGMEIEVLAQKLEELDQLVRGKGLAGVLNFRQGNAGEDKKSKSN
ncbi:OPA3-like protein [Vicia villosa]|uniref:OPA3-like protein n=1 Tax=Vicia villosa TaxID=3911 RepID=UPI00273AF0F6|nr:OPA3-like protein [Vicia villosa]